MAEIEFAVGFKPKTIPTEYGEIIDLGIDTNRLHENYINERGWLNVSILKSKNGNWYVKQNTYRKEQAAAAPPQDSSDIEKALDKALEDFGEEIPFL